MLTRVTVPTTLYSTVPNNVNHTEYENRIIPSGNHYPLGNDFVVIVAAFVADAGLNLPTELFSERILPFLEPKWLDTCIAVAESAKRQEWLHTLSKIHHFEECSYELCQRKFHEIRWLCSKNIVFYKLEINRATSEPLMESLICTDSNDGLSRVSALYIDENSIDDGDLWIFLTLLSGLEDLSLRTKTAAPVRTILYAATQLNAWISLCVYPTDPGCPLANKRHPNLQELILLGAVAAHEESVVA